MRAPYTMRLARAPRATLTTASTSGLVTVDMNVSAASVFSTTLTIDANEKTSTTAATAAVLSSTLILFDDEITFDIDAAGTGAKGLKVTLFFSRVR
jgi:mannose/fructose/N-acetylgalactosamine-specific phosphotransferase system component IIC